MKLSKILCNIKHECIQGKTDIEINDIVYDSRNIIEGSLFVCLKGSNIDGHQFAQEAVGKKAAAIITSENIDINNTNVIMVDDTREALSYMSAQFFNNPALELITIGITGTKGKTTTSCMIKSILEKEGYKTGLIGTLGVVIGDNQIETNNTTPESYEVQKYLRKMVDEGCKSVVIEASSLGLKWHRVDGLIFDYAIFTNFSADHIGKDEHESLEEYLECKSGLFRKCKFGLLNKDDKNWKNILNNHTCRYKTYGFSSDANFISSDKTLLSKPGYLGVRFNVGGEFNACIDVPIPGGFSVYNALAAASVCYEIGASIDAIKAGIDSVKVKGRVEPVDVPGNYTLLIDYAHNAMSMENILKTLREYNPKRLVTLFGAGGNRAKSRRYETGEVSGNLSDLSVITADNSRFEDVLDIIEDIKVGINKTKGKYITIPDRREAIKYCLENAKDGDIIVFAGKGHEDYQDIGGIKYHFDEREIINDILKELKEA